MVEPPGVDLDRFAVTSTTGEAIGCSTWAAESAQGVRGRPQARDHLVGPWLRDVEPSEVPA